MSAFQSHVQAPLTHLQLALHAVQGLVWQAHFPREEPLLYGLHANAAIQFSKTQGRLLRATIQSLEGRVQSAGGDPAQEGSLEEGTGDVASRAVAILQARPLRTLPGLRLP